MNKFVNIVNFVRGAEPRCPERDLFKPVTEEIKLVKKYNFPNTFLLQYDALINPDFQAIFKSEKDDNMEIGIWIECVRQLVEKCDIKWRGAEDVTWDWHIIPGFLMAYTQAERKAMVDEFMAKFKEVFGCYPKTVGSWLLDSYSVAYMQEKYNVEAFLMCREQYGVDAYTIWGGYYNQGYYPAKNNVMCPAQTAENAVGAPIFKMLGPDPIYCYDESEFTVKSSGCATMEAVWEYGYREDIFKANMDAYYKQECMDFAYTTIGQENSFGWEKISKGLPMQLELVSKMRDNGELRVEKVCDTGRWFKENIKGNSTVSLISDTDWSDNGLKSIWFSCPKYRVNLFCDNGRLYFRDINKFDEKYDERYLVAPCETMTAFYDNLPVVDGRMWNDDGIKSGLKFSGTVGEIKTEKIGDTLVCTASSDSGEIKIELTQDRIIISKPEDTELYFERGREFDTKISVDKNTVNLSHRDYEYQVSFNAELSTTDNGYKVAEKKNVIEILFG